MRSGPLLLQTQPIGRFAYAFRSRFNGACPNLPASASTISLMTWHVHYAGVRVGVIVERSGAVPFG
jgi:hypothetical protein